VICECNDNYIMLLMRLTHKKINQWVANFEEMKNWFRFFFGIVCLLNE
jgi:hypothetical protein